ncbi:MscS Mechanosensitive ion channel [Chloroherpeton thalassium ATCC 35110]|uniref:MscS Mechanosensitive ion channel n=1 Tax=Chloroherpeton thalassium (strain ATCC 35110 / GB-78) TaxID=517418 RepID=B3QYD0_CHLT3|nr:mechanosensitive ion channel domain-containing protein [Chloroherpeton thalassium]ACF15096.1 MscS Mechanosensitive ion channel [Chloroherpeton thalassium ATCC 35110]
MQSIWEVFQNIIDVLESPIFNLGANKLTVFSIVKLILTIILVFVTSRILRNLIAEKLLSKETSDIGTRLAVATIVQYVFVFFGLIIVLQTAGIDLSTLTVLSGTIGIGIGFGLQNIMENFVSGIIILLERPIKIGDRIEVGNVNGDVIKISVRSTTVKTNNNIVIIIPNSEFISSRVINWSHTERVVRFAFPVGVSYKSNPEDVKQTLLEVAGLHQGVLKDPKPDVLFRGFGDSSLDFELRVWTKQYTSVPMILQSELNFMIFEAFTKKSIEIPFPQRDINFRTSDVDLWKNKAS